MRYFLIALTIVLSSQVRAQSTEDSIKAVINSMFDGMREADTVKLKNAFSPTIVFQTIARTKENKFFARNENPGEFISYMGQQKAGLLDERITFGSVLIDGPLASVWTPYTFYAGGKFSHCGVNSFQLVRFPEGWKIQYIIDTRRKEGCGE
jgi:hypothetical protein